MAVSEPKVKTYHGKYRGVVFNNIDPEQRGRILATVADVSGLVPGTWAEPCVPMAGLAAGVFAPPPVGSGVWIEFERGDPDFPIYVGGYWGSAAELPKLSKTSPPPVPSITFQTPLGHGLVISDMPPPIGGISITSATGAKILVNDLGITIDNGKGAKITLLGNIVAVNDTSLTVIG
jgi:hypothetical protein